MAQQAARFPLTLAAYDTVLRAEVEILDRLHLGQPSVLWRATLFGFGARAIQLQHAVRDAVRAGYADELAPLARSMLSALVNLAYIRRGRTALEQEARFLAHLTHYGKHAPRFYDYLWRSRFVKKVILDAQLNAYRTREVQILHEAAARGVSPAARVGKLSTWTGLSDRELFKRTKYLRYYQHYYLPWSNESHAGPTSLNLVSAQTLAGTYTFGPHYDDPFFDLHASAEIGIEVVRHLGMLERKRGMADHIRALRQTMEDGFRASMAERTP